MVDIFDEVEEDLRAERATRLMKKYGWLVILAAVAIVGGVAGWQLWNHWQASGDAAVASRFVAVQAAIEQAPPGARPTAAQIETLDQLAASAPDGYKTLARLRAAGLKADAGDLAGAVALWDRVAADPKTDVLLRDLASLTAAMRQLDQADPAQLQARLEPLAVFGNPWSALAREQLAMLDLRLGKADDAKAKLKALSTDFEAPAGVRARAAALLAGLG